MRWFNLLFGIKPNEKMYDCPPAFVPESKGVLFGIDPPKDHYFDVRFYDSSIGPGSWYVDLVADNGNGIIAKGYGPIEKFDPTKSGLLRVKVSDEEAITTAAKEALSKYKHSLAKQNLVGHYPPKSTQ